MVKRAMRLLYIVICSTLFLAFMLGLRWLYYGISDEFGYGMVVGAAIFFFLGYYAGMTDQKRKVTDDL